MTATVGVRELRQNLSIYLRRVRAGERLVVTERHRPVALLAPLPEEDDPLERLIATGEATRPVDDMLDVTPLPPIEAPSLSEVLEEMRGDRC